MVRNIGLFLLVVGIFLLSACALEKTGYTPPEKHPVDAELPPKPPICIDCHEARDENFNWAQFNHTIYFGQDHRQQAYRQNRVCSMCHTSSFCSDCHGTRVELKPSDRNPTQTYRRMQHRGDYLSRHRIDGRVDPSSCFRCHGNPKTAANCARCHG
ncbi:MAG: cytochrome C [Geopsychrobacter sp.]|nr:cytochrome C [Geopsychrobacter sp.]